MTAFTRAFRLSVVGILLLALVVTASIVVAGSYPARQATYINDHAELLTADTSDSLNRFLADTQTQYGIEMVIVTISRISDYGTDDSTIEPFATHLFNTWGIGDAQTNKGVMLLVAKDDRKVRLELGRGWSTDYNAKAEVVIDETILPAFRQNDYNGGIERGTHAAIETLTGTATSVSQSYAPSATTYSAPQTSDGGGLSQTLLVIGAVVLGGLGIGAWLYISTRCPQCGQFTLSSSSVVLEHPTYYSSGQKEVTRDCSTCGYHDVQVVTIAMLSRGGGSSGSSGGGSSGSGSSGGGSSSGGGASGSW